MTAPIAEIVLYVAARMGISNTAASLARRKHYCAVAGLEYRGDT